MARTRRDVWTLTDEEGDWPVALLAYEQAVGMMRALDPPGGRPVNPLGWRFQAAIHGLADGNGDPDTSEPLWCNCQHGSWYFLPWHRMYLRAFEAIVQHVLDDADWSLPYWYAIDPDDPRKAAVPPAFLDTSRPENNLQTEERSQTAKAGQPFYGAIDPAQVGETVLATLDAGLFATPTGRATFGGGERADLSFDGGERGLLENVPHGAVHSLVGNDYDQFGNLVRPGWMGSFYTAGLDPLFWMHHANIDRLWEVWLAADPAHREPAADPAWVDTAFTFPAPEGGTVTWRIGEVLDTASIGYVYESLAAPGAAPPEPPPPEPPPADQRSPRSEVPVSQPLPPLVMGAVDDVPLGSTAPVTVPTSRPRSRGGEEDAAAERVYLRVEGLTGSSAAPLYGVYLNVPSGESPADHPELRAGSVSTFGLLETSRTDEQHDAEGLTASFDVTALRDRLAAEGRWDDASVQVSFTAHVPGGPVAEEAGAEETVAQEEGARRRPDVRARRIALVLG